MNEGTSKLGNEKVCGLPVQRMYIFNKIGLTQTFLKANPSFRQRASIDT